MYVFSVVATQQILAPWAVILMSVTMAAIVLLTFVIFRQPQSKAKLTFKVSLNFKPFANFLLLLPFQFLECYQHKHLCIFGTFYVIDQHKTAPSQYIIEVKQR